MYQKKKWLPMFVISRSGGTLYIGDDVMNFGKKLTIVNNVGNNI